MAKDQDQQRNGVRIEPHSSAADMSAGLEKISDNALSFMANVPAQYLSRLANSAAYQATRMQHDADIGRKRGKSSLKEAFDLASLRQQQIDNHKLSLTLGGKDIEITQGELRRVMGVRVEELNEQKLLLERTGGSPEEIERVKKLTDKYGSAMEGLAQGEENPETMNAIYELDQQDPRLLQLIERSRGMDAAPTNNRRTSYANETLGDGGIAAPSLMEAFMRRASPVAAPEPGPAVSAPAQRQPATEKPFQSLGF